jgi:hypothetical protein
MRPLDSPSPTPIVRSERRLVELREHRARTPNVRAPGHRELAVPVARFLTPSNLRLLTARSTAERDPFHSYEPALDRERPVSFPVGVSASPPRETTCPKNGGEAVAFDRRSTSVRDTTSARRFGSRGAAPRTRGTCSDGPARPSDGGAEQGRRGGLWPERFPFGIGEPNPTGTGPAHVSPAGEVRPLGGGEIPAPVRHRGARSSLPYWNRPP